MATKRRRQLPLPGIEPGRGSLEITIPTMPWKQIGGDMSPSAHGGTIATADGSPIELIKIQPVREYVGDREAADVGFPFWTRTAYFTIDDLGLDSRDVQSALESAGPGQEALEDMDPEQRALAIAEALLEYGHADEGPAGWSGDLELPSKIEWWSGKTEGSSYLEDEDEAFKDDVLGYSDIRRALEEQAERYADQSAAEGWSTVGDATVDDLEDEGYDPKTVVGIAEFGDAVAVNGDREHNKTMAGVEAELEREGYECTDKGGRIPSSESEVYASALVGAVAQELGVPEDRVEDAAKSLDWWQEYIPWGASGYGSIWAKKKAGGVGERRGRPRSVRAEEPAPKWAARIVVVEGDDRRRVPCSAKVYDHSGHLRSGVTGHLDTHTPNVAKSREYVHKWIETYFPGVPVEYTHAEPTKSGRSRRK